MSYRSLRDFVAKLEAERELVRVRETVSTVLEMTEIQTRLLAEGGPAVLFENPIKADGKRSDFPVLVNLFGTVKRVAMGVTLGGVQRTDAKSLREVGELLATLRQPEPPRSLSEAVELVPLARTFMAMQPKTVSRAPCQQIVVKDQDIDLNALPVQTCWPNEPAPLITWPLVVTKGPSEAREDNFNLGIYRMQVLSRNQTIMRWLRHRGGAQHHRRWGKESSAPFPAAAVLGADPGTIIAAVTPVPETLSEYQFAGLLRGARVELAECVSQPLKVPAEAEIVIEGEVSLTDYRDEGPYGDHTGYYNSVEPFPVLRVTAVTSRRQPIYLSTFTGRPPDEPSRIGEALNRLFVPLIRQQFPEVVDCWLPPEACSYRIAIASIKKRYPGQARRLMLGLWSMLPQFSYTKLLIVVDDDIDIRDWRAVMWAVTTRSDSSRDLVALADTPIDYLDFASPKSGLGGKLGIDATTKIPPETDRVWGEPLAMDPAVIARVDAMWSRLGVAERPHAREFA